MQFNVWRWPTQVVPELWDRKSPREVIGVPGTLLASLWEDEGWQRGAKPMRGVIKLLRCRVSDGWCVFLLVRDQVHLWALFSSWTQPIGTSARVGPEHFGVFQPWSGGGSMQVCLTFGLWIAGECGLTEEPVVPPLKLINLLQPWQIFMQICRRKGEGTGKVAGVWK